MKKICAWTKLNLLILRKIKNFNVTGDLIGGKGTIQTFFKEQNFNKSLSLYEISIIIVQNPYTIFVYHFYLPKI